ncbi:MAG: signal peptidase II [Anaerolineae bacterium]|nr:signal peptidase II [Anaerolineae bacterium]MDQ7036326.1 signal peptidase II [Anaerolineae bacterium]
MRKWVLLLLIASLALAIDQMAKAWVIANMEIGQTNEIIPPLAPYFQLTRITNTGIAFGMFTGGNSILLGLTSIVVVVLLLIYRKLPAQAVVQQIAYAMIFGGALGNIIDRVRFGHVVDFVHVVIPNWVSNVSNFADHFVFVGVVIILVDSFLEERREKQKAFDKEQISSDLPSM